jgi:2-methylcitrate dehydratase PrpD
VKATQRILDFARADHVLPPAVREAALHLLADTLATGAAGSTAPGADGVLQAAQAWGQGNDARILAKDIRLPAAGAAFVNAFQIHCLEWDAVHEPAVVHALSTVTATLLAVIDRRGGCDPEEALAALAVGVDIASGLGLVAESGVRFFRPATAGVIGSALAAARIDGVENMADVMGLAYSQCAGTMQAHVEGSIALPLQVAGAARSAVAAVDLVKAGLTGPHNALEGPFGYFTLYDQGDISRYADHLGDVWRIAEVSVKPYPSGRASHAVLSAMEGLQREGLISADNVASIEAFVPPLIQRLVGRPMIDADAMSPAYGRLCLPLLTALQLADGRIDPRRFTAANFADAHIRELASRLTITLDGNQDPNALGPQRLLVTLKDGSQIERQIPNTLGHPLAPMNDLQNAAKYGLARELAASENDLRLFADPLAYVCEPQHR